MSFEFAGSAAVLPLHCQPTLVPLTCILTSTTDIACHIRSVLSSRPTSSRIHLLVPARTARHTAGNVLSPGAYAVYPCTTLGQSDPRSQRSSKSRTHGLGHSHARCHRETGWTQGPPKDLQPQDTKFSPPWPRRAVGKGLKLNSQSYGK